MTTYTEGLRRGGTLLTAHVDETHVDRAIEILEQHGSIDLDERETSWRGEGWTGGSTAAAMATPPRSTRVPWAWRWERQPLPRLSSRASCAR